ncbi:hypothetical protein DSECCO2_376680 [anaerobic digester metagenome]
MAGPLKVEKIPDGQEAALHEGAAEILDVPRERIRKRVPFELGPHLVDHGVADEGHVAHGPAVRREGEAVRVRSQGQVMHAPEALGLQGRDVVRVPGEERDPVRGEIFVDVEDEVGVVDEPRGQGQLQPGQEAGEDSLLVHAEMIDGQHEIGAEGQDFPQHALHELLAAHLLAGQLHEAGGVAEALAGRLQLAHEKIGAGQQEHPRLRRAELGVARPTPEIDLAGQFEPLGQDAVELRPQPGVEGVEDRGEGQAAVTELPAGQHGQRGFGVGLVDPQHPGIAPPFFPHPCQAGDRALDVDHCHGARGPRQDIGQARAQARAEQHGQRALARHVGRATHLVLGPPPPAQMAGTAVTDDAHVQGAVLAAQGFGCIVRGGHGLARSTGRWQGIRKDPNGCGMLRPVKK